MKEDHLKKLSHPDLQRRAERIRQSVVRSTSKSQLTPKSSRSRLSAPIISSSFLHNSKSMDFNSISFHATDLTKGVTSLDEVESSTLKPKKCGCSGRCGAGCCGSGDGERSIFSKCFMILRCKHHALEDASVVRRCHQEEVFMEEQSLLYEKQRSLDDIIGDTPPLIFHHDIHSHHPPSITDSIKSTKSAKSDKSAKSNKSTTEKSNK